MDNAGRYWIRHNKIDWNKVKKESSPSLYKSKRLAAKTAMELCYGDDAICKIAEAKSNLEIERILATGRGKL